MEGHEMRRWTIGAVHGVTVPSGTHAIAGEDAGGKPIGTVGIVSLEGSPERGGDAVKKTGIDNTLDTPPH